MSWYDHLLASRHHSTLEELAQNSPPNLVLTPQAFAPPPPRGPPPVNARRFHSSLNEYGDTINTSLQLQRDRSLGRRNIECEVADCQDFALESFTGASKKRSEERREQHVSLDYVNSLQLQVINLQARLDQDIRELQKHDAIVSSGVPDVKKEPRRSQTQTNYSKQETLLEKNASTSAPTTEIAHAKLGDTPNDSIAVRSLQRQLLALKRENKDLKKQLENEQNMRQEKKDVNSASFELRLLEKETQIHRMKKELSKRQRALTATENECKTQLEDIRKNHENQLQEVQKKSGKIQTENSELRDQVSRLMKELELYGLRKHSSSTSGQANDKRLALDHPLPLRPRHHDFNNGVPKSPSLQSNADTDPLSDEVEEENNEPALQSMHPMKVNASRKYATHQSPWQKVELRDGNVVVLRYPTLPGAECEIESIVEYVKRNQQMICQ